MGTNDFYVIDLPDFNVSKEDIEKNSAQAPGETMVSGSLSNNSVLYSKLSNPQEIDAWIDLYRTDVWIKAASFAIARVVATLPIKLYKKVKDGTGEKFDPYVQEIDSHPILDLLDDPNPDQSKFDLFEALSIYLDTVGYGYWEVVYDKGINNTGRMKRPAELYNIRPSLLTPDLDSNKRKVTGYTYQSKKWGKKKHFGTHEIVPFKYFNPLNDLIGQGSAQPAADEIQTDNAMLQWNKDFFLKGTIDGMITTDKSLSPKEVKDFKRDWNASQRIGGRNTIIASKGLKYDHFGAKPNEVDFLAGRKDNRNSILSCMGVPGVKVNILENATKDNYKLQEEDFNRNTVVPRCIKIASSLNKKLLPLYHDLANKGMEKSPYFLAFDTTLLLKEDKDKQSKRITQEIAHSLKTPNEGRKEMGMEPMEDELMNKTYMHKTLVPLEIIEKLADQENNKQTKDISDIVSSEEMDSRKEDSKDMKHSIEGTD